jgi:hypothetical protein
VVTSSGHFFPHLVSHLVNFINLLKTVFYKSKNTEFRLQNLRILNRDPIFAAVSSLGRKYRYNFSSGLVTKNAPLWLVSDS